MITIGFFNNKGGVGKTSLVYHVAWMLAELGHRCIAADFDPQANLSSFFLDEERLEELWSAAPRQTVHGAIAPLFRGIGDIQDPFVEAIQPLFRGIGEIQDPFVEPVHERIGLLVGDLNLSGFEDDLSLSWAQCAVGQERAFRVTSALARTLAAAGKIFGAEFGLVDVGPNLGALNRAALLACDGVVVPLGADLFSLQGLRNMGPAIRAWRAAWADHKPKNPDPALLLPAGTIDPLGYIVTRHSVLAGRPARAFGRWIERIPDQYREFVLAHPAHTPLNPGSDPNRIAQLKDYRSLMPLAQEARKPMFHLRPADGAFGGHQQAVAECYTDFKQLTEEILLRTMIGVPPR